MRYFIVTYAYYSQSEMQMTVFARLFLVLLTLVIMNIESYSRSVNWKRYETEAPKYEKLINFYSQKYRLDPDLVRAVITWESGWGAKASNANCNGLMQVKGASFTPQKNINSGCSILRKNLDLFNSDTVLALSAYNQGAGRIRHKVRVHGLKHTGYAKNVLSVYNKIKERYGNSSLWQRLLNSSLRDRGVAGVTQVTIPNSVKLGSQEQTRGTDWRTIGQDCRQTGDCMKSNLTESQVQSQIVEYLKWHKWKVMRLNSSTMVAPGKGGVVRPFKSYHVYGLAKPSAGAPDLLAWKKGRCLMVEVKKHKGVVSSSQKAFKAFMADDCEYYVCCCLEDIQKIINAPEKILACS